MTKIKTLCLLAIFVLSLLLISTMNTYAGTGVVMILDCGPDLTITNSDTTTGVDFCDTASGKGCEVGDPCTGCIFTCLAEGFNEEVVATRGSRHTRYLLICSEPCPGVF